MSSPAYSVAQSASFSSVREFIESAYPVLDFTISHSSLQSSSQTLLLKVFPNWRSEELVWEQCTDGITNKLMKYTHVPSNTKVLIRAYGKKSELIIDRSQELINMVCLSEAGLCPAMYARFRNGFVYGYAEGIPFKVNDMSDPHKSKLVAKTVANWHKVELSTGKTAPRLFTTLWKWFLGVPTSYDNPDRQEIFSKSINMPRIKSILSAVEKTCTEKYTKIVFCHNDLLSANIIYQPTDDKVVFIDYEYGCYNYRGFDIANHFCEYAGFECDYSKFPSKEQQLTWLEEYWREYYNEITAGPTKEQLEVLYREARDFVPASHLYWGLWGLIQGALSDIPFDYIGYAVKRFNHLFEIIDEANNNHGY